MDRHGDPTPAAADDDSIRRSPLDDPLDFIPVGSPEEEILYPPTDEDHDPDHNGHRNDDEHGQVHDQNPEVYSATDVLTDDLKKKIIKQAEYYFSDEKLPTDKYMMGLIKRNKEGFVLISEISSFRKMKKLTRNYPSIVAALKESSLLVVSSDGKKVKRRNPLPIIEVRDPKHKKISIRDPHAIEESKKSGRADILISSKLHALVEFETVEAAEKAVTTLNNEHDWRNGMHVKLLERMGTHGQRKQAREDLLLKKTAMLEHLIKQNEENNISSEHHEDIPYDEDGEHLPKEKNGQRYRTEEEGGDRRIMVPMDLAMELHPHAMPLNCLSHPRALECPTERGDSQWVVDGLYFLNQVCDFCFQHLWSDLAFRVFIIMRCTY
ncbi:Translation initiation factor eIF-2B subunit delta, putative isoform 3 [Hibiscus syriacus]|uniref:Translation initiation factor eIF-2B subunit delta, putative isoform 3 n=1 Tax=Hibiscus syriacus TaxID=106335 RepID=A0A6A3B788_HIBSY|nr:Translation initiation factor eIF-2B subunit delta, putative isoform 3 [Hibiscus syriacus]